MGERYLIDTCVVIKYLNNAFPEKALTFIDGLLDQESRVSFITKIELLAWKASKLKDMELIEEFLNGSKIHFVNDEVIGNTIRIRNETNVKLPDALIAATAISHGLTLLSDNDKDFFRIVRLGLKYTNPRTEF